MEKVLPISFKLNFTPNTLGCYGLNLSMRIAHPIALIHRKQRVFLAFAVKARVRTIHGGILDSKRCTIGRITFRSVPLD